MGWNELWTAIIEDYAAEACVIFALIVAGLGAIWWSYLP